MLLRAFEAPEWIIGFVYSLPLRTLTNFVLHKENNEKINRCAQGLPQNVWRKPNPTGGTVEVKSSDEPCKGKVG
jgi:hypothetical protein